MRSFHFDHNVHTPSSKPDWMERQLTDYQHTDNVYNQHLCIVNCMHCCTLSHSKLVFLFPSAWLTPKSSSFSPFHQVSSSASSIIFFADVSCLSSRGSRDVAHPFDSLYKRYTINVGPWFSVMNYSHFRFRLNSRNLIRKIADTTSSNGGVVNLRTMDFQPAGSANCMTQSVKGDKSTSGVYIQQSTWSDVNNENAKFTHVWHHSSRQISRNAYVPDPSYLPFLPCV